MIVYVDRSDIRDAEAVRAGVEELAAFAEANEPQLISYGFYFDPDVAQMTVVAVHPDSASLELHLEIGRERFRALGEFLTLRSIDVYGDIGEAMLDTLQAKAEMLGDGGVTVHAEQSGFARV